MTEIDIELMADEAIDVDIADVIETGGSGGIINYNLATNKPRVNGIELKGDKSIKDLGIDVAINEEVAEYVTEHKAELKGEPGKDGFAPVAVVSQMIGGAVLTVTDKNGTTSATIANGLDGFAPSASVTRAVDGAVITITDKDGTTSAKVFDGQGGSTEPVNYLDAINKPSINGVELIGNVTTGGRTFNATVNGTRLIINNTDDGNGVAY